MPLETFIPLALVFATVMVVFLGGWWLINRQLAKRREELRRRMSAGVDSDPALFLDDYVGKPAEPGFFGGMMSSFDRFIERTGLDLLPQTAFAIIVLAGAATALLVFIWRTGEDHFNETWLAIPAFFLGTLIPLVFFAWRVRVWRQSLKTQLPDVFYLIARSLRAGRSIDQAVQLVGEQGVPPLSKEFARIHRQLELGLALGPALRNAALRLNLVDFNVFASVVSLHRSTGGILPIILDRLASATRDHNHFDGQYRAATVLGRYSATFIAGIAAFILAYLFFYQRDWAMRFFESTNGIAVFFTAVAMEIIGAALMFWLVRHEY
jgi:Flp pilus assembly protein TadB